MIVSIVPLVIYFSLNLISPTYYGDVADDPPTRHSWRPASSSR